MARQYSLFGYATSLLNWKNPEKPIDTFPRKIILLCGLVDFYKPLNLFGYEMENWKVEKMCVFGPIYNSNVLSLSQ